VALLTPSSIGDTTLSNIIHPYNMAYDQTKFRKGFCPLISISKYHRSISRYCSLLLPITDRRRLHLCLHVTHRLRSEHSTMGCLLRGKLFLSVLFAPNGGVSNKTTIGWIRIVEGVFIFVFTLVGQIVGNVLGNWNKKGDRRFYSCWNMARDPSLGLGLFMLIPSLFIVPRFFRFLFLRWNRKDYYDSHGKFFAIESRLNWAISLCSLVVAMLELTWILQLHTMMAEIAQQGDTELEWGYGQILALFIWLPVIVVFFQSSILCSYTSLNLSPWRY
jgi:hypothetical protein